MRAFGQECPHFSSHMALGPIKKVGREISRDGEWDPFPLLTWNWSEWTFRWCETKGNRSLPPKSLNSSAQKTVIFFHLKQLQDIAPGSWEDFVTVCVKCYIPWQTWGDRITVHWYSELTQRAGLMTSTFRAASNVELFWWRNKEKPRAWKGPWKAKSLESRWALQGRDGHITWALARGLFPSKTHGLMGSLA